MMKHCRFCRLSCNNASVKWQPVILALLLLALILCPAQIFSQERGNSAMAEHYALWAKNLIDDGKWDEALAALERSSDFADVSSDISYLLSLARFRQGRPRYSVLDALEMALAVNRWNMHSAEDAILLKAENLIAVKMYSEALHELSKISQSPREAELRMKALVNYRPNDFLRYATEAMDRYPRECGIARIFFNYLAKTYASGRNPRGDEIELLELTIRRLPVLLSKDAELAWMAAPFMRDTAEARRLVMAYRAVNKPVPASLPAALKLGVIDAGLALEELFGASASKSLDMALLDEIWELLRRNQDRDAFKRNLSMYSGVITEDADKDGINETIVEYNRSMMMLGIYDSAQDRLPELTIRFEAGDPKTASYLVPPERTGILREYGWLESKRARKTATIIWERYPSLEYAELEGAKFIPRPLRFQFSPVKFTDLWGSGVLFPKLDPLNPPLTKRVMVSEALRVERPSAEFKGGIEIVELEAGIPIRAREYVGDLMAAETDFLRGRPQLQRVDLDFNGRMETFRFFKRDSKPVEIEELWNYNREYEKIETIEANLDEI